MLLELGDPFAIGGQDVVEIVQAAGNGEGIPAQRRELGDHAFHLVIFRGPVAGHLLHNGHAGAHVGRNFVQGVQQAGDFLI